MIWAPFFLLGGVIIQMFTLLLAQLNWTFPDQITSAIITFVSVFHAFASFLPFISTIVAIYLIIAPAYVIRYIFDIARWIFAHVPFIGSHNDIPHGALDQPGQPYYQSLRASENNKNGMGSFYLYKRKKGRKQS